MKHLQGFRVSKKQILVRNDFNVPLSSKGTILDDFRIRQGLFTIRYLIKEKAKTILISHLGRPQGNVKRKAKNVKQKYSLRVVAKRLERLLDKKVKFLPDCLGKEVEKEIKKMKTGEVILLENLRFYKEERENNEGFAKELSKLADIFINDAFAVCHRTHASIVGIPKFLPSGAGFLLEKEVKTLEKLLKSPQKPFIAIIGGKKVESKIKLINKISKITDFVLIGGLISEELKNKKVILKYPQKVIKPKNFTKRDGEIVDIGIETINLFKEKILEAKTIFWAGPLGKIEKKEFSKGSYEIARAIIKSKALSVIGGGETIEFINKIGLIKKFDHISTGGGAMLSFLSGEKLPGIEALK